MTRYFPENNALFEKNEIIDGKYEKRFVYMINLLYFRGRNIKNQTILVCKGDKRSALDAGKKRTSTQKQTKL